MALAQGLDERAPCVIALRGLAAEALGRWVEAYRNLESALARSDQWVRSWPGDLQGHLRDVGHHVGRLEVCSNRPGASVQVGATETALPTTSPEGRQDHRVCTMLIVPAGRVAVRVSRGDDSEVHQVTVYPLSEGSGRLTRETIDLPPPPPPPIPPTDLPRRVPVLLWVTAAGIGAVGLTALVTWGIRDGTALAFNAECFGVGDPAPSEGCRAWNTRVDTADSVLIATGVVGGGLLAAGVWQLLRWRRGPAHRGTAALTCAPGPGDVGVACAATF
ncbi:MAG: hypothetical protein HY909_17740 [Deltaproteobacteria bacterium]|nr:hypothetical protein [Deltaproteobacteria bacterium]